MEIKFKQWWSTIQRQQNDQQPHTSNHWTKSKKQKQKQNKQINKQKKQNKTKETKEKKITDLWDKKSRPWFGTNTKSGGL